MMQSRIPQSSQSGPHRRLDETVLRHLRHRWRSPVHDYSRGAFAELAEWIDSDCQLVLDSGCGTGASTRALAARHPDCRVIGVDKSAARLGRAPELPDNARLVRADLPDLWRLMGERGLRVAHHYLLYPNPWPKAVHLMRRWHGHPVFPDLLALGGRLVLRSNHDLYIDEFARALCLAGVVDVKVVSFETDNPVSPFERKYLASGHRLFQLTAELE
jgi:tRNA (guanine-N7-)-methyltransferase